jgi:hypothetical protein
MWHGRSQPTTRRTRLHANDHAPGLRRDPLRWGPKGAPHGWIPGGLGMGLVCHWSRDCFFSVLIFWIKTSYVARLAPRPRRPPGHRPDTARTPPGEHPEGPALIAQLRDENAYLRQQLDHQTHIVAGLVQRLAELPSGAPPGAVPQAREAAPPTPVVAETPDTTLAAWRRWWRRVTGSG